MPKSLILYASWTGNTDKVAERFRKVFLEKGWECDMLKVDHHTDVKNPPFLFYNYDFLCVGSPVVHKKPIEELISIMAGAPLPPSAGGPDAAFANVKGMEEVPEKYRFTDHMPSATKKRQPPGKIVLGPDTKKGVVFVTYSGAHLGPKEAEPALAALSLEMEHLPFECVGRFCCPGKHGDKPMPDMWYKDLMNRPSERDLLKAEIFMAEILEELD